MASNYKAKDRINFVKELMERKKVDCLGPVLYNMTDVENIGKQEGSGEYKDWRKEKLDTIKGYKFTIAFENEQSYNYVTEKIYQPLVVGSIPIYWGAPNVNELFNQKCFVNVNNFSSYKEAIDEIIKIDEDDEYYKTFFEEELSHIFSCNLSINVETSPSTAFFIAGLKFTVETTTGVLVTTGLDVTTGTDQL